MRDSRPSEAFLVKHTPTGVLHRRYLLNPPTPDELKRYRQALGEPIHVLRKEKIRVRKRQRGVWQYNPDRQSQIFFTCPWCGAIGVSDSDGVGNPDYESIWCGGQGVTNKPTTPKSCGRHLSLIYRKDPRPGSFDWKGD